MKPSSKFLNWVTSLVPMPLVWLVLGICLFSLIVFVKSFWSNEDLFGQKGFADATNWMQEHNTRGTFVVVWPPHQNATLKHLPEKLMAADAVYLEPNDKPYRRFVQYFVIGPRNISPPQELASAKLVHRLAFDQVEVVTFAYENKNRLVFDLREEIGSIRVELESESFRIVCDTLRAKDGFSCPKRPPWNHVAPTAIQVQGKAFPCVWAHPVQDADLVLDLGKRHTGDFVEVETAFADPAALWKQGTDVYILVEQDGAVVGQLAQTKKSGVSFLRVPTQSGSVAHFRIRIRTKQDARRHLGINVRMLENFR